MSKILLAKKSLLTEKFPYHIEKLPSYYKPKIKNLLLYFFSKKLKNKFSMEINGSFWK
jgi:hypothetical protein